MKKDEKSDTLAVNDKTTFMTDRQTYIRIWRLYDRPGPEGRVCENNTDDKYVPLCS